MKKFYKLFLIFLLVKLIVSCGPGNTVKVNSFSPTGEVEKLTNIVIEFSEDLAPPDVLDKWLDEQFIKFEPAISGKFKWTNASTLVFSPDAPLEPIQSYSATINQLVLFDKKFSPDFEEYNFHTPYFDVIKVDFFWTNIPHQSYKLSVQANIRFNYPVDPSVIKEYLVVMNSGTEISDFQIVSDKNSETIAINFGEMQQTDTKQNLAITIKQDLQSVIGKEPLSESRTFESNLPPITKLAITGVTSGFDGSTGWIEVSTTQTLDKDNVKNYITSEPKKRLEFFVNENQLRIETSLADVQTVDLFIKKGLPGLYGGTLEFDFEQTVSMVDVNPSINFVDKKGKYLLLRGQKNLQVNAVNINEAEIEVSQVFKNNILHFLNQYSYYYYYDEYNYGYNPSYYVGDYGKSISTEKIKFTEKKNWLNTFNVNLDKSLNQKYRGIYVVSVRSADERWISDSKMLAVSDIGIITKLSGDEIIAFVNSIAAAEPINDAVVTVISTNNQEIISGKTDSDGMIRFTGLKEKLKEFSSRLIVVEKDEDFNYLDLRESLIETSRYDVGGITMYSNEFNSFIYSPRDIYRPGEEVNLSGIIRNDKIETVKDIPVLMKVITPTGKTFDEFKRELNEQGSFVVNFNLPDYAQTGRYAIELYTGSKQIIGAYSFSVEEFVPDKIRLNVTADKKTYNPGDKAKINLDAEFLFGAKAAGLNYDSDVQLKHRPYYSKNFSSYDFTQSSIITANVQNTFTQSKLDENGKAEFYYDIPSDIVGGGIFTGSAYISVFDLTGRTVNRSVSFDVYPKDYFIGIKSDGYYFGTNEKINFKFVAVKSKDEQQTGLSAIAKLVRYEWQTVLKKDYSGKYYYASEEKEVPQWEKNIELNGETHFQVVVSQSGKYELRVSKKGSADYQKKVFYAYGWGASTASSFEVDKEGRVEIVFDKEEYKPGDNAKILFTCPFSGRLLVTFERNNVQSYRYVDVKDKSVELEVPVSEEFLPNIYVSATLFKKHTAESNTPFLVGHGFKSMKVVKKENKLPVSITSPKKIKPKTTQQITIKTEPRKNIYVTLAAVDEGILQVSNFKTPDPFEYMYGKRPLMVESYNLYKLLLPEIVSSSSSTGGDGDLSEQLMKRTTPITVKRFKLLTYWSGIKKTDSEGVVNLQINIPQFNGEVRLMAVAYTDSRFGSAQEFIKVADDLIIEPEIPRFLSLNDTLIMPVTVINNSDKDANINLNVKADGVLKISSVNKKSLTIKSQSMNRAEFKISAGSEIGAGKIIIETDGFAKVKEEVDIAVRPVSPLVAETGNGTIKAGEDKNINIPSGFLESTKHTTLTISKFPAVQFAKQLKYLVGYPHGCIEQTVSKLFPQIYFEELARLAAPEYYRTRNPVYYVNEGIKKIEALQLYDGSMAYWQGGTESSWWGSVYAAHFLVETKKAGYNVSENVLDKLLSYLSKKVTEPKTFDYVSYSPTGRTITKIAMKEIIYSLYVLALAGKGDISTMNYYKSRPHLVSADSKYLLAGAFALMDKWNSYYEVIPNSFEVVKPERQSGGNFDSEIRANAIMLNVLLEVEPTSNQIPDIIKYLTQNAKNMYSTQESAFAFLALGKAAKINADANVKVEIYSDGSLLTTSDNKDITVDNKKLNKGKITLKASGKGEVYYFWSTEGVKLNAKVNEKDSYMKIRRTFYSYKTKREITNNVFYQGELIVCKISLTGGERSAENIVITDLIPAGFQIENPRLNPATELSWQPVNPIPVQYLDVRDDRLFLFTNLQRNKMTEFYYLLRVVNQGSFQLPVIGAEAMYDQEFHSYHGAGVVKIHQRLGD